jgi:hypothetical protein
VTAFRVYEVVGEDGYPPEWHRLLVDDLGAGVLTERSYGLKDLVRKEAGHRCVRCGHPYFVKREGNITSTAGHQRILPSTGKYVQVSRCDDRCRHGGPVIYWTPVTGWGEYNGADETIAEEVYAVWRVLTVHHLDGDKTNCRWWNLAALCQRCHLTIQGRVVMARVWPWEHTEWFRPYVAGYYASVYLDEELDREQTLQRLDELLALERVVA